MGEDKKLAARACGRCEFYDGVGECHRFAPAPIVETETRNLQRVVSWPQVRRDDWCGEFRPVQRRS